MSKDKNQHTNQVTANIGLREQLDEKQAQYAGKMDVLGLSSLTFLSGVSSSRAIMSTTHSMHARNLVYPENPKLETGFENMAGDLSTGYKKAKSNLKVFAIIPKYNTEGLEKHLYTMFLYDEENDKYEVVDKRNVEDLTEKYGFLYNNTNMDDKEVGDEYHEGEVIYASNSYDEHHNYRRGINAKFVFMIHNDTIEDAAVVSESFAKRACSIETEVVRITLNDNDALRNRYYKGKNDYRGFPDIGEQIKDGVLAAKFRFHNDQILYSMNTNNLKKINYSSDTPYYCDGVIEDIIIYSNKSLDEIPNDSFNRQIKFYLELQTEYYTKLYHVCKEILESGSKYSSDITFMYQKAKDILDNEMKWKDEEGRKFNNFIIEFLVKRTVPMTVGQKITGRYGNKGVISKILPDDEMPILETGERVDLILNSLGVINRLNPSQIFENSVTFITNRSLERINQMTDYKEKNEFLVKVVSYFNEKEAEALEDFLKRCDLEKFYKNLNETGIIIRIPPLWDEKSLFERIRRFYAENDWIKPYEVYMKRFGRWVKVMKDLYVGDMYILKLKQSSSKGLIARATGSISRRGVPVKTKKPHKEPFSKTPIRLGDGENNNLSIGIPSALIAKMHLFYRSSPVARQELGKMLSSNVEGLSTMEVTDLMTNRNVEILNAYFKFLGVKLSFKDRNMHFTVVDNKTVRMKEIDVGKYFVGTDLDFIKEGLRQEIVNSPKDPSVFKVRNTEEARKELDLKVEELFKKRYKK